MADDLLFAADIARLRGVSVRQAERILAQLERKHGGDVVGRLGAGEKSPRRYTTMAALERIMPTRTKLSDLYDRVQALEDAAFADAVRWRELEARLANVERRAA